MASNPTRTGIYIATLFGIMIILIWLNPTYCIRPVDQVLVFWPWVIVGYVLYLYWVSEGHRWAYSLVTHQSHSSTAEGKPSFVIPPKDGYPEMIGFAKDGTRFYNFYRFGGRKDGFLIAPSCQVLNIDGHRTVNTIVRTIHHTALPPHIRVRLENDRRFSKDGMVEFGTIPYLKNIKGDFFDSQKLPDMELMLDRICQDNDYLREENEVLTENLKSMSGIIREITQSLREVPSEQLADRMKKYAGGEGSD